DEHRKTFAAQMSGDSATYNPKPNDANVGVLWIGRRDVALHGSAVQDEPADKSAPMQRRNYGSSRDSLRLWSVKDESSKLMLQREFRQVIQCDGAGDLQTLRADFVQRIIRGMPPGIIKINDIDRWNPNDVQRRMIVDQVTIHVAKVIS